MWLCGCVAVWLCGCVSVWLCGCVAVWLCGRVSVWLCGCVVKSAWFCGVAACVCNGGCGSPLWCRRGGGGIRWASRVDLALAPAPTTPVRTGSASGGGGTSHVGKASPPSVVDDLHLPSRTITKRDWHAMVADDAGREFRELLVDDLGFSVADIDTLASDEALRHLEHLGTVKLTAAPVL